MLAFNARDETRECYPGGDWLTHATGMTDSGIRKALIRLAGRGYDVRVPLTKTADGRAVFAVKGHRAVYRLPRFERRQLAVPAGTPFRDKAVTAGTPLEDQRRDDRVLMAGPPSRPTSHTSQLAAAARAQGINGEDLDAVVAEIKRRKPNAGDGLVFVIVRDEGAKYLADVKSATKKRADADAERRGWVCARCGVRNRVDAGICRQCHQARKEAA